MNMASGWWMVVCMSTAFLVSGLQQNEVKTATKRSGATHTTALTDESDVTTAGQYSDSSGEGHGSEPCCGRHQKLVAIGFGVNGEVVQLDVGHCRKSCKKTHMDAAALLIPTGQDSSGQDGTLQACPVHHVCAPAESRLQRVSTLHGVQEVEVIDRCECRERPSQCKRLAHQLLVYPGTPHETRIDVGTCGGHCSATGTGCRALRNQTLSVPGPNGDQCHSVVAECICATSCYRASHRESVYDYTEGEHKATNTPLIKEIDVGKCVGSCAGDATRKCVFRDRVDPSRCLAGLYSGRRSECAPGQFAVHRYLTKEKEAREIISITDCRCA